jgi:hypothetical protein
MKNLLLFLLFIFITCLKSEAQVGINTTNPNSSSILEINASNKGILIPRVALTSTEDETTIENPANSLLVFNTSASNNIQVGYYYWSSEFSMWIKMLDGLDKPGKIFATFANNKNTVTTAQSFFNSAFNYSNIGFNNIAGARLVGTSLILPSGDYEVESSVYISRDAFDYILRVNGVRTGLTGTMATVKTQEEIVAQKQIAVFTLTRTSSIDFISTSSFGGATLPVDPTKSYLSITKF